MSHRYKRFEEHDDLEIETTNISTVVNNKQNNIINVLTKLLIMFLVFAGSAIILTITISLIFVYINCTRPSRIHKQIPIEYLNTPRTSLSEHIDIENI